MSKGQKTSPEKEIEVMTSYAITDNINETSRNTGTPKTTVKAIVDRNKNTESFEQLRTEKRNEFVEKANEIIDKALKRLSKEIDTEGSIPINHLTTVIGTLYDKRALANGESTSNQTIKVEMDDNVKELSK